MLISNFKAAVEGRSVTRSPPFADSVTSQNENAIGLRLLNA